MSIDLLIIIVTIAIGFSVIGYLIIRSRRSDELVNILQVLQTSAQDDRKTLIQTLQRHTAHLNDRLDRTSTVISSVQKSVGEMNEIGRSMQEIQQLLHAPKIRGSIGEQVLKQLLSQVLPHESYSLQYTFKSGSIVDAAITTQNGIIPIDAKFPLSSYRQLTKETSKVERAKIKKQFEKDVKKHIDDISGKYILPEEGTIDYALMYIPSEAVFYEMVNNNNLLDYSNKKRVLPVSPITFYAFIKAILMSLEGERMNTQAKEILSILQAIQKDYDKVDRALEILTKHVTNSYNALANLTSSISRIGQKIDQTSHIGKSKQLKLDK